MAVGAHLTLATLLSGPALSLLASSVALFAVGRVTFLIGYPKGAGGRAFGMATTALPTLCAYLLAIVLIVSRGVADAWRRSASPKPTDRVKFGAVSAEVAWRPPLPARRCIVEGDYPRGPRAAQSQGSGRQKRPAARRASGSRQGTEVRTVADAQR